MSFLVVEAAKHTTYPRWGRLLPYHDVVLRIDPIKIALTSLVLLLGPPEAYAVRSIAAENPTAQFAGSYDSREIRDKINRHKTESPVDGCSVLLWMLKALSDLATAGPVLTVREVEWII